MGLPMGQQLVKSGSAWARLCRTHISETFGWIYTIWSSMKLSRPVVVQHHGQLTLTLYFEDQIFKMLHLRNGMADWHGTKGMWVDRMLDPYCDIELFKVKFWKSHNSGMGWLIDMKWKGCESTECWIHVETFNFDLAHDLDFGISRWNFENAVFLEFGTVMGPDCIIRSLH